MTINVHQKGDRIRISMSFADLDGTAVNPDTVTLEVMDPSGNIDSYHYEASPTDIVQLATGSFYKDVEGDESGDWHYWVESTGSGEGTQSGQFVVEPTHF